MYIIFTYNMYLRYHEPIVFKEQKRQYNLICGVYA